MGMQLQSLSIFKTHLLEKDPLPVPSKLGEDLFLVNDIEGRDHCEKDSE